MFSMVGIIRGHTKDLLDSMELYDSPLLAMVIFFLFTFLSLMYVVVFGLLFAVMLDSYKTVRQQMFYHSSLDVQDYELAGFIFRRFKRWIGVTKPKPVS